MKTSTGYFCVIFYSRRPYFSVRRAFFWNASETAVLTTSCLSLKRKPAIRCLLSPWLCATVLLFILRPLHFFDISGFHSFYAWIQSNIKPGEETALKKNEKDIQEAIEGQSIERFCCSSRGQSRETSRRKEGFRWMHQPGGVGWGCHTVIRQFRVSHSGHVGDGTLPSEGRAKSLVLPVHNTSFHHHNNSTAV